MPQIRSFMQIWIWFLKAVYFLITRFIISYWNVSFLVFNKIAWASNPVPAEFRLKLKCNMAHNYPMTNSIRNVVKHLILFNSQRIKPTLIRPFRKSEYPLVEVKFNLFFVFGGYVNMNIVSNFPLSTVGPFQLGVSPRLERHYEVNLRRAAEGIITLWNYQSDLHPGLTVRRNCFKLYPPSQKMSLTKRPSYSYLNNFNLNS